MVLSTVGAEFHWPSRHGYPGRESVGEVALPPPIESIWSFRLVRQFDGGLVGGGGRAFIVDRGKFVLRLDLRSGRIVWETDATRIKPRREPEELEWRPREGKLYVGLGGPGSIEYAEMDPESGTILGSKTQRLCEYDKIPPIENLPHTVPCQTWHADGGSPLALMDRRTGKVLWGDEGDLRDWSLVAHSDARIVLMRGHGRTFDLRSMAPLTRELQWEVTLDGDFASLRTPSGRIMAEEMLFYPAAGAFHGLDLRTGTLRWKSKTRRPFVPACVIGATPGTLWVAEKSPDGGSYRLVAYETGSGKGGWTTPIACAFRLQAFLDDLMVLRVRNRLQAYRSARR